MPDPTGTVETKTMTFEEWNALGHKLFGDDKRDWRFRCVMCGQVQSHRDFTEKTELQPREIWKFVFFSCLGRWDSSLGCDWTLGGMLHFHALEVDQDGEMVSAFEFDHDGANDPIDASRRGEPKNCEKCGQGMSRQEHRAGYRVHEHCKEKQPHGDR